MRNSIAKGSVEGIGIKARQIADGRCVKTIVYMERQCEKVEKPRSISYLDVADTFGDGGRDQSRRSSNYTGCKE